MVSIFSVIMNTGKCQCPSLRADERVQVRTTSCSQGGKLSLKVDESQVDQRHEDAEENGNTATLFSLNDFKFYMKKEEDKLTGVEWMEGI